MLDFAITGAHVRLHEAKTNVMMIQHFISELEDQKAKHQKHQKVQKPKRKMTAARRKAMLANLKKGREALAAKRNGEKS
jgi:NADH:ubiquinone oxidoreductase subunit D